MTDAEIDQLNLSDIDDDGEELITAQKVSKYWINGKSHKTIFLQVLENLENAWTNEVFAPEMLPHQTDMLELMIGQVAHMEENMKELDKNDFRFVAHQMELERIRYIMASYLRCRLQKIETYTRHILNEEAARNDDEKRLSPEETKFAQEYLDNVEQHFHHIALQYMPNMQRAEAEQRIVRPNLMSHVFIKANVSGKSE